MDILTIARATINKINNIQQSKMLGGATGTTDNVKLIHENTYADSSKNEIEMKIKQILKTHLLESEISEILPRVSPSNENVVFAYLDAMEDVIKYREGVDYPKIISEFNELYKEALYGK